MSAPAHPTTKWGLILYSGEISPQNPLAAGPDNRKVQVVYWTIRELGGDVRYAEQLWFTLTVIRSAVVQGLRGGMTNVLHHMLPLFFGDSGHNIRDAGIALDLGDFRALLFCDIAIHVSDEPALASVLGAKRARGQQAMSMLSQCHFSCMGECSSWTGAQT